MLAALGKSGSETELTLLHEPTLPESAWSYAKECLDTKWVSSAGAFVTDFENQLAKTCSVKHAIAVVNGTTALQVCFSLAGVQQGTEVLLPGLSFVATANAVCHAGGVPHFIDIDKQRNGMSPEALSRRLDEVAEIQNGICFNRETGRPIVAVCPMHCLGTPCDMHGLLSVAKQWGIALIEDAAEALGSTHCGQHLGTFGVCSALSFNGNKLLTTGGGGAILTDEDKLAERARHLTSTAKIPHKWESIHDEIGWNFRMPNLNAAIGLAQLEILDELIAAKRLLHERYRKSLSGLSQFVLHEEPKDSQSNYWLNCVEFVGCDLEERDSVMELLARKKLQCRPFWKPLHQLPMFENCPRGSLQVTDAKYENCILLPSSPVLAIDIQPTHSI